VQQTFQLKCKTRQKYDLASKLVGSQSLKFDRGEINKSKQVCWGVDPKAS
jgi:hypothetical protein